jgi:uncharacterized protein (DUF2062 family)
MGIIPIWGFQLIVAIALSFQFRLNKALVILAAHISIVPMIPVIIFLSHRVGAIWMGAKAQPLSFSSDLTFGNVQNSLLQYVVGAITLAIVAGIIFGFVTYGILKMRKAFKQT